MGIRRTYSTHALGRLAGRDCGGLLTLLKWAASRVDEAGEPGP